MTQRLFLVVLAMVTTVAFAAKPPKPVDDLEARIAVLEARPGPVQVLANGESIGIFLDSGLRNGGVAYLTLSSTGYFFQVHADPPGNQFPYLEEGDLGAEEVWFDSPGCAGQAAVRDASLLGIPNNGGGGGLLGGSIEQGVVFRLYNPNEATLYYVPAESTLGEFTILSNLQSDVGCYDFPAQTIDSMVLAYPNAAAITGVPNEPFTPPITLGQ